ncbi:MAG: glutamate racemase [Elusimicrobia bacterium]|nr:glutamate racemase [Elusimicrobiota bacterium]
MRSRPIGVFDSGLGGLTVFKALAARLPHESLIYFGDTAHVPYGSKSKEAVTAFSISIGRFLEKQGIKALVVACNTASALALKDLKRALRVPVLGVIEPGVRAVGREYDRSHGAGRISPPGGAPVRARSVGVIATEATIASGAYQSALRLRDPRLRVVGAACPLFVPLVEEGWWSHRVTREVAAEYVRPLKKARIDTLILGCTHYPLLKGVLRSVVGRSVRLIDSAEETARATERLLVSESLARTTGTPKHRFFASDGPDRFLRLARRFLGVGVDTVEIRRLD